MPKNPHDFVDESAFTPEFLAKCSDLELIVLAHDLRAHPEDRRYREVVMEEIGRRDFADLARTFTKLADDAEKKDGQ
jgi:hypothetical protein